MSILASPAAREPLAHSWEKAAQEGMRRLALIAMPLIFVFILVPMAGQHAVTGTPAARAGFGLLVALQLLVSLAMLMRWYRVWLVDVLMLVHLASMALLMPTRNTLRPGDLWSPGQWAAPLLAFALATYPRHQLRRRFLPLVLAMVVIEVAGPLFFWHTDRSRIADDVLIVQPLWALFVFGTGIATMAAHHDRAARDALVAHETQAVQRAQTEGRREAARILHDHVLHALHAIAEDRTLVPAREAVGECNETLDQLDRPGADAHQESLEDLLVTDPVVQRVAGTVNGSLGPLPAAVAETLAAAAHEAVVNVERHADARTCTVRLESFGGDGGRVTVTDDGRGFDPNGRARGRLGLQRSVRERLDDIGGQAVITSAPGEGTTVELTWPRATGGESGPGLAEYDDERTRRVLAAAAVPGLLATAALMVLMLPRAHPAWPMLFATVAVVGLGFWHAARVARHGMSRAQLVVLLSVAATAWLMNLAVMPPSTHDVYQLWLAWGTVSLVQLAMLTLPNRGAKVVGTALMVLLIAGLWLRFGFWQSWHYLNGAATAGAIIVVVGYNAMFSAQRIAAQAVEQAAIVERTRDATARMHQLARVEQFWSDRVTEEALPLIRSVATGTTDPDDDAVRRLARQMESSVRDELVLGPGQEELTERMAAMRRAGWQVQSSLAAGDDPHALRRAASLLRALGSPGIPGQLVTLSTAGGHVNAVVLDATDEQQSTWHHSVLELGGHMDLDPDFARITLEAR